MSRHSLTVLFLLLVSLWSGAAAAVGGDARGFVDSVGKKVLEVVNGSASESQKQQQLQQMFTEYADSDWMGKFALGAAWNQANQEQRDRYLDAYHRYMLARYTSRFADYTGARYDITSVKNETNGQFTVSMKIKTPGEAQDTTAGYRLRAEGESFKIIDIIVENLSQITTQRSEFGAVVQQKGIDGLIQALEEKIKSTPAK